MNEGKMLISMFLAFLIFIGFTSDIIVDSLVYKTFKHVPCIVIMFSLSLIICGLLYNTGLK